MSTVDKKKVAADCWRRGNEAVAKENWDYAIQMYATSVKLVPDNLMYRQSLRGTEHRKYGDNKTGAKMAGMRLMGIRGKIKKARMGKDWAAIDEAAEEGLQVNPWDVQLNTDVGDACKELGYHEVAKFAYMLALETDKLNIDINKALAAIHEERSEYNEAVACWQRILKAQPDSGQARSKITQLGASSVMDRGGYEGAESTRGVMADHEIARRLNINKDADGPGTSVEADLQRAIRKDPANKDNYLKLADHYKREGQLEQAGENYQKALEASGGDINIREMVEDVQLDLMRRAQEIAKQQARQSGADGAEKQRAGELAIELIKREIEVFASRVERYPADMRLKFELATRYMRVQKWQLAIPLFQQSRGDPRVKGESLVNLGRCFAQDKKPQLARRQYEAAVPDINFDEKPDLYKELFYRLGQLCEEMKDSAAAEEYYQKVLEVDYNYRDTVDRLNKLQGGDTAA